MEEELLKEYVSTYLNPKYNSDWDVVNSKFPELSGVDKGLLKEYVATYLNPKYNSDWDVVNSKFPELFQAGEPAAEQPVAEPVKKKDTVSPFVDGGSELTKFDPTSGQVVQDTPVFAQKQPEVKVPEQKLPERTEFQYQPGKPLPEQKIDFDSKVKQQKVSTPMSYSNIFAKTIADLPSDLAETWSVASAFIERQLGKAGVPGANPNLTAKDIYFYNVSDDWRKYTDEVFPTNQEDRSTFLGGVVSGLGQAVPMVMSGGISAVSKGKAAMDIAKAALSTGTKLTPFIKMGKDLAKQAASPSGLIGGSQMSSSMYRQAIDSGATEDQAQQYAIENFFVGTVVESLPIQSMFSRILKKEPTANILRILKEGGVGAGEEFTTEMWQATYENWSAQRIYDFNREMLDGVGEAGAVGGTVGFILNTALAALVGRRARVKTKEEEVILDKSIDEVKSKINTVNKNNENISGVAEELESIEPIVLNYGDSKYFFAKDKSGRMELADEPMLEDQAKSMSNMLGKVYKGLEFSIEEVASNDPYTPVKYNVIAKEKINEQQDAIQEQAAGQVPVQPGATVSQEVAQGEPQAEPQGIAQEGIQEQITEGDIALSGLRDGFQAVTRNSFDVRSDADVMQKVGSKKSFATSVTKNGKKYLVVGLKLNQDVGATTSGRDGYSFATIEDNGNLPSNAIDVLTQKAVSNISSVYPNIKNPSIDLFSPIEGQVVAQEATPQVDFTEEEVAELEKAVSRNLPEYFQLATKKESPQKMAVLTDAATKLMDEVQPEIVEQSDVVSEPSMETIPITVTENVELANKVPKMSVNDLVGKKVNYVMADQLKVDDELMGGPFFPLMDDTFGKVAWASMDIESAKKIIRGFIKGDYSVVYNMSPSAVDSNIATLNEFVKRLNSIPASENVYPQVAEYLKGRKFGKDTKAIQDVVNKSSNLESFIDGFKSLNVDQRQEIIKAVLPSKSVKATTKLGSTLQKNNITQESVREAISEQFARNLPMGAMTMVLEITDAEGNPIRSEADIDKAIMTRDQQTAEGIRTHKNYPVYIRGRAVAMLEDTVPVWNVSSRALDTMNKKSAGIIQKKVPQAVDKEAPVKRGVPELFELTPELAAIGTVKDYSDYLDTIFPDSQIKNVAYHDSNSPNIEKFRNDINGIWTTGDPNWWQKGEYKYRVLLDVKSPKIIRDPLNSSFAIDFFADKKNDKFDSYITTGLSGNLEEGVYVLRDSDQTHILGSKKDLNDFKKFVSAKPTETRKQSAAEIRADEMYTLQRSASRAEVISRPINTQYQSFVNRLSKAMPSVEIVSSQAEFDNLLNDLNAKKLATKNQKIYGAVLNGKLYLNPGLENFNTPVHEFGHVWMNAAKELSPEIYNKGIDLINNSEYVSQVENNPEYRRVTTRMKEDGMTDEQIRQYILEEALATAIGDKGESFVSASQKKNFKNWLNQLFEFIKKMTGISKLTPEQIQNLDLDQFLNGVVVDLLSENPIFKNSEIKTLSKQLQLMAMPDLSADDIVKIGLANGFSTGSIRELLNRRGFTEQAINEALAKDTPAAKKVEVTEELAPGYDRMIAELEGVVEKSLNRGTTQVRAMENAINYLQGTKVYENATDVQREQMVRDVNKRFKKREKRAPTAEKVVGKPKKKEVTVDEMAALKDQIKLEARAAREAKGDLNDKRKALADKVSALKGKGTVTTNQIDTIVKRIERTNLDNPIMVDRLLAYIEKVFDNANYAADMTDLRKLQKQARSRNHTSMTDAVNQFTSINPEDIPLDKVQDYKKALDFLNNRTPSYTSMNEIYYKTLSYQVSKEFDAVKTNDDLIDKYKSIISNKVKTVQDYVALIKDINSFKRKAYQLLKNEAISQEEYNDLIDGAGQDQSKIERNFSEQIAKIKSDLISEIKTQRPKTNPEFSNEENDLIRRYLELSDSDLKSLSPEDLFVLNDLLENIRNGEIDPYRFNDVVSRAYTSSGLDPLAKQINDSKFNMTSEEGRKELSENESAFWEGLLGMGRAKAGALQKFIVSPFNRAIASYENSMRKSFDEFLKLKKKYDIDNEQMNKIGMLTTYLQEHMAQFDPKNNGIDNIGKRDWFKEILSDKSMRSKYSTGKPSLKKMIGFGSSDIDVIEKIWKSLPKDKDGNVDPKEVYDSYDANDGKFFNKKEKAFFDDVMKYKAAEITPKQKIANEINGASFKEILFHMMRFRLDGGNTQIAPTSSYESGVVRVKAGTGKERISEAVGPIMTNFETLFIKGLEQTSRDYFLSKTLKDINNTLSGVRKKINKDKLELLDTISYTLSDALAYEFERAESNLIFDTLLAARAAQTLLDPIRTGVELGATAISYPTRAEKMFSGYKALFGDQKKMSKLLEFTDSPLRLRENINKAIDINDGKIEPQSRLTKMTTYLSGLPERTMMVTSWMPTFISEFQSITGEKFDINKFNDSSAYREKYGKAIREASAVADTQTEKIIGPTTKAAQRREIRIAPKWLASIIGREGTVSKSGVAGKILGFFSNYPYRETTEFINGFKESAELIRKGDVMGSLSKLQKPLGVSINLAAYGFLGTLAYAGQLILLGDEDDEERGNEILESLLTPQGALEEFASNAASLVASKYSAGGKALLQLAATIAIESTDDENQKAKIKKILKNSVFVDPLPVEDVDSFIGKDKALVAIARFVPQFVLVADRYNDLIGTKNEIKAIYDKVERNGIQSLTKDEELQVLALNTSFTITQAVLNVVYGTSIPAYNRIKTLMKGLKEEAGVAEVYKGEAPAKKKSSGGGGVSRSKGMNKTDMKKYNPKLYDQTYGPGSALYEVEQQVKEFEKQQRELKKRIKDQTFGGG
jgi:hypothetical protein